MKVDKIIILSAIIVLILAMLLVAIFFLLPKQEVKENLNLEQVMEILNGSSGYSEFLSKAKNFEPELSNYFKLDPNGYEKIKPQWQEQGFGDRVAAIEKLNLNNSTYWVELKNKNQGPSLFAVLDLKAKKSLLIIGSLSIKTGVGI